MLETDHELLCKHNLLMQTSVTLLWNIFFISLIFVKHLMNVHTRIILLKRHASFKKNWFVCSEDSVFRYIISYAADYEYEHFFILPCRLSHHLYDEEAIHSYGYPFYLYIAFNRFRCSKNEKDQHNRWWLSEPPLGWTRYESLQSLHVNQAVRFRALLG